MQGAKIQENRFFWRIVQLVPKSTFALKHTNRIKKTSCMDYSSILLTELIVTQLSLFFGFPGVVEGLALGLENLE